MNGATTKLPDSVIRFATRLEMTAIRDNKNGVIIRNSEGVDIFGPGTAAAAIKFMADSEEDCTVRGHMLKEVDRLESPALTNGKIHSDGNPLVGTMTFRSLSSWRKFYDMMMSAGFTVTKKTEVQEASGGSQLIELRKRGDYGVKSVEFLVENISAMDGFKKGGSL
jgi:hypothetical protein